MTYKFFPTWDQDSCSRLSVEFSMLNNQNVTSIEIQKKMEDLGEAMKTHVLNISWGSCAWFYPLGKLKSHKDFWRWNTQYLKMVSDHEFSR